MHITWLSRWSCVTIIASGYALPPPSEAFLHTVYHMSNNPGRHSTPAEENNLPRKNLFFAADYNNQKAAIRRNKNYQVCPILLCPLVPSYQPRISSYFCRRHWSLSRRHLVLSKTHPMSIFVSVHNLKNSTTPCGLLKIYGPSSCRSWCLSR